MNNYLLKELAPNEEGLEVGVERQVGLPWAHLLGWI